MSDNQEAKKIEYLAAKSCGDIWNFNFRLILMDVYKKNIPTSTYANWFLRGSLPDYINPMVVSALKKRTDDAEAAYMLHTFGVNRKAEDVVVDGLSYSSDLEALIRNFLAANIERISSGTVIYFKSVRLFNPYIYRYKPKEVQVEKSADDGKASRKKAIKAIFPVNYFTLSLEGDDGWFSYQVSRNKNLMLTMLTLRDDLKEAILKTVQIYEEYKTSKALT